MTKPVNRFAPTDQHKATVSAAARIGIPEATICEMIENPATGKPIDAKTLRKHFRKELDCAQERANAAVGARLYRLALDGNVAACIFWMKTRAGWREVDRHEITAKDGAPLPAPTTIGGLSPEQMQAAVRAALDKV